MKCETDKEAGARLRGDGGRPPIIQSEGSSPSPATITNQLNYNTMNEKIKQLKQLLIEKGKAIIHYEEVNADLCLELIEGIIKETYSYNGTSYCICPIEEIEQNREIEFYFTNAKTTIK